MNNTEKIFTQKYFNSIKPLENSSVYPFWQIVYAAFMSDEWYKDDVFEALQDLENNKDVLGEVFIQNNYESPDSVKVTYYNNQYIINKNEAIKFLKQILPMSPA